MSSLPREAHELDEIRRIADAQTRTSDRAAILLMGRLGLRKMECARVRVRDVDLLHDRVTITRAKGGGRASVPIVYADVREALEAWLAEAGGLEEYVIQRERTLSERETANDARASESAASDSALSESAVHRWFKRCLRRAWAHDFPMHELRHSAATELYQGTLDVVAAQKLLRHKRVSTTSTYLHADEDYLRERMGSVG